MFRPREYLIPANIEEAATLLSHAGEKGVVVGGGTFLHGLVARGLLSHVEVLIDLRQTGLDYMADEGEALVVGPMVRFERLLTSPTFQGAALAALRGAAACPPVQVRTMATIGGTICAAMPTFDIPCALVALGAEVVLRGPSGQRVVPLESLFLDYLQMDLRAGELLEQIRLPRPGNGAFSHFARLSRTHNDLSLVNCAVSFRVDPESRWRDVRIALGGVAPTIVRATNAESVLEGETAGPASIESAAVAAKDTMKAWDDFRASASYRREVSQVLLRRTLAHLLGSVVAR